MTEAARKVLVREWANELAGRTGRSVAAIEAEGLVAGDFSPHGFKISYEDGSVVAFRWAFFLRSAAQPNLVAAFTEHCGYHEFVLGEEDLVESCGSISRALERMRAHDARQLAFLNGEAASDIKPKKRK